MPRDRIERAAHVGQMLEHVVEDDDVEPLVRDQRLRKETVADPVIAMGGGVARDLGIGLDPICNEPALLCRVEEPAMAAADLQQRPPGQILAGEGGVEQDAEIGLAKVLQRRLARSFVEMLVLADDPRRHAFQGRRLEPAGAAVQPGRSVPSDGGIADRAIHAVTLGEPC